jgi:hypothetical protein
MMIAAAVLAAVSCGGDKQPATPLETFKTYTKAIKQKDTTTMKILLSDATIKMHEKEAKAQGVTVDDIVKRETLFSESQKTVEFRGEKIEGDKASLQVKNAYGVWETVPFVREDGVWKIDKAGYADQLMKDIEENNKKIDQMVNGGNDSSGINGIEPPPSTKP